MTGIIRWGVLGNAMIARDFLIPAMEGSEVGRVDAIASRGALPADFLPNIRHYDSYEALLADPEIDAVYVPVPNAAHPQWAIAAMDAGKHVLCEKPLACTLEEVRSMVDAAKRNNVLFMEAFMYRWSPKFQKMMEIVNSGVLGRIINMQGSHGYPLTWASPAREDKALGGGCIYDVGCYVVDCMNAVMAQQGNGFVNCGGVVTMKGGVDHSAACWLQYENGVIGGLQCWFNSQQEQRMLIVGEKGTLNVPMMFEPGPGRLVLTIGEDVQIIETEGTNCYRQEAEAFSRVLLGESEWLFSHEESLSNALVLEQLVKAVSA